MYVSSDELIEVFEDTEKFYESDETLKKSIEETISKTKVYMEGEEINLPDSKGVEAVISVGKYRTFETAQYYHKKFSDQKIAVLNFASATNPGGGVKLGSHAQEESLCRCSTLYPSLANENLWKKYYEFHRQRHDIRYTDSCIYTPDILVIKSDTDNPQRLPQEKWIKVDVITCAAPNLRFNPNNKMNPGNDKYIYVSNDELFNLHVSRAKQILSVAAVNGVDILILGAFGCGAFQNDPSIVAKAYAEVIPQFKNYFNEIAFAIYCPPGRGNQNFTAFKKIFG